MNFVFNLILFCITFLSQLHSVYLAVLKTQSVSRHTPTNSPVDSKEAVVYRKMKPICGPVPFPEYSCEELGALQTKQSSFADTSVLEIADDFPKVQDSTVEPMYGQPEYIPQSSPLSSDGSSHTLQDVTDFPQANGEETVSATVPYSIPSYRPVETFITESLPYLFDSISKVASVQNTESYTQALGRVTTQNMSRETKKSSYYSSTSKPVFARSGLRDNSVINLQKVIVTKSTYPFYPGGTTPEKDPEPSQVDICRLAKCVRMDWKDPSEFGRLQIISRAAPLEVAVMKLRETSPKPTEKTVTGLESPPLLSADDTYYFNEDIQ